MSENEIRINSNKIFPVANLRMKENMPKPEGAHRVVPRKHLLDCVGYSLFHRDSQIEFWWELDETFEFNELHKFCLILEYC